MKNWPKKRLGDLITVLTDYHANGSYEKLKANVTLLNKPDYAVMIRTTNFERNDFLTDLKYITEDAYKFLAKSTVYPGDILMNKIASPGSVYLMPDLGRPVSLAMNLFLIRTDQSLLNQSYAYNYLKSNEAYVKSFSSGAAAATITKQAVRNLEILVPDLTTQLNIVNILSTYDDLIQNNTRRMAILEEIARRIYEEWFIHFRFPGHEKIRMVESKFGLIPSGWEVRPLCDLLMIYRGRSYKGSELVTEGGLPFINLKCINRDGGFRKSGLKRFNGPYKATQTVKPGDLVVAVTDMTQERRLVAHCGRVPRLDTEFGVVSMDLVKIEAKKVPSDYLYSVLRWSGMPNEVKQYANGANVLHLSPERIEDYKIVFPGLPIAEQYDQIISPMLHLCDVLEEKNTNLRTQRDLLLPKLISGELDVSELPEPKDFAA